jgi:hypothetical protein
MYFKYILSIFIFYYIKLLIEFHYLLMADSILSYLLSNKLVIFSTTSPPSPKMKIKSFFIIFSDTTSVIAVALLISIILNNILIYLYTNTFLI